MSAEKRTVRFVETRNVFTPDCNREATFERGVNKYV